MHICLYNRRLLRDNCAIPRLGQPQSAAATDPRSIAKQKRTNLIRICASCNQRNLRSPRRAAQNFTMTISTEKFAK